MPSPEYLLHQARHFHTQATENLTPTTDPVLCDLAIAVDYLIQAEETRQAGPRYMDIAGNLTYDPPAGATVYLDPEGRIIDHRDAQ